MPIAQLATGVPKTLGGLNEITQANRAVHTSAGAYHLGHTQLPDAQRFGGVNGDGGQALSQLPQRDNPDDARTTPDIADHIVDTLADKVLNRKVGVTLNPVQLFMQAG